MQIVKKLLKWIGILLGALILLILLLLLYLNTGPGKRQVSEMASKKLGREVVFSGSVAIPLSWPPALRVRGLSVANMEGGREAKMADIGEFEAAVSPGALLMGRLELPYLRLLDSTIHLERNAEKNANWTLNKDEPQEPKEEKPLALPVIGILDVRNSHLTYLDVPQKIDLGIDAGANADEITLTGKGTYLAQGFGLKATGGSLNTLKNHEPYPIDSIVTVGHTRIHAKGTIQNPASMEGLDLSLSVRGADMADLFPLLGIALPPTPPYDVVGQLNYDKTGKIWRFKDFHGKLGDSDLSGRLSFEQKEPRPKFAARLVSKKLDFKDLRPLIGLSPKKGDAVSAKQKEKSAEQAASPYVIPDVPLDVTKLKAMDADVEFTGKKILSPSLPLDDFYLKVLLDDRILKITPVKFGTADGDIKIDLTVNGREEPFHTDADFRFRRLSITRLMEGAGQKLGQKNVSAGYIGGAAKLKGSGKSLRDILASSNGSVGIGMEGGKLSNLVVELIGLDVAQGLGFFVEGDAPTTVRCIIGDFAVKDGLMTSNALVADTVDTNIEGRGTINLKGEKLDIHLEPHPKDASFLSLRTPINVEGTLKHPSVSLEKTNLAAKAGAAVAIGIVLTPIASVLGFVDPGLGEDSDCAKLIRDMHNNNAKKGAPMKVPVNKP